METERDSTTHQRERLTHLKYSIINYANKTYEKSYKL